MKPYPASGAARLEIDGSTVTGKQSKLLQTCATLFESFEVRQMCEQYGQTPFASTKETWKKKASK
jgi:hypothetical protein